MFMTKEEFGYRLAQLRQQRNISARKMSYKIGNSDNYINKIELGKCYPKMENFMYICECLGITPEEFFKSESNYPVKINEIINEISSLNEDECNQVLNFAKTINLYKNKK